MENIDTILENVSIPLRVRVTHAFYFDFTVVKLFVIRCCYV